MNNDQGQRKRKGNSEAAARGGLGRSLSELLTDNDGIPNMCSRVVIKRDDGSRVKIYDKTGSDQKEERGYSVKKR